MKVRNIHANVWIGGVLIILSAIFYGMAGKFVNPSAAVWPRAVLVGIIILSALLVLNGVKQDCRPRRPRSDPPGHHQGAHGPPCWSSWSMPY